MGVVYLVRHGQASFGAHDYDALSKTGEEQARVLGRALRARGLQPHVVLCGGMQRHRQTAQLCLEAWGLEARWDEDVGWNEYDHEAILAALDEHYRSRVAKTMLEHGDPRRAFQAVFEQAVARWVSGEHDDDYDESWSEFVDRVSAALERTCQRVQRSEVALVFTSGGAIGAVAKKLLGVSSDTAGRISATLANASLTKLLVGQRGITLSTLNEHGHLESAQQKLVTYR